MNYDYYEKTFSEHAVCTSNTKGKGFIPIYTHNSKEDFEKSYLCEIETNFVSMKWPRYHELYGAPSRNRT